MIETIMSFLEVLHLFIYISAIGYFGWVLYQDGYDKRENEVVKKYRSWLSWVSIPAIIMNVVGIIVEIIVHIPELLVKGAS